jgi:hypothetical protein
MIIVNDKHKTRTLKGNVIKLRINNLKELKK